MKNAKTILFASLIAAMILPFSGMDFVEAKKDNKKAFEDELKNTFSPIDEEIKSYVNGEMKYPTYKKTELKAKYANELEQIVSTILEKENLQLSSDKKNDLKDIIVEEHMKELKRQKVISEIPSDATIETIEVDAFSTQGYFELPEAYAIGNPFPINSWKQLTVDRNGGSGTDSAGNYYDVNGGNQFTTLTTSYTSSEVTYTLKFNDEDHPDPATDASYDAWRSIYYGRTYDLESFKVDNSGIHFSSIWDNNKPYAEYWGQHGDVNRNYYDGVSIYVSNVWNHAMDIYDNNPGMSKTNLTT